MEILPKGAFFPKDKYGFIINPCDVKKISKHLLPVLDHIISKYIEILGDTLIAVYLRGSVARGMQIENCYDIDTFALVSRQDIRWDKLEASDLFNQEINELFGLKQAVEWMISSYCDNFIYKNPRLAMILKTQSLCLYGRDIKYQIPPFKPGKEMMLYTKWLAEDIRSYFEKENSTTEDTQNIIKTILRTGFELVMEREQAFTPDLFLCCQSFGKYYPELKSKMDKLLFYFVNPPKNVKATDIKSLIKEVYDVIVLELRKKGLHKLK